MSWTVGAIDMGVPSWASNWVEVVFMGTMSQVETIDSGQWEYSDIWTVPAIDGSYPYQIVAWFFASQHRITSPLDSDPWSNAVEVNGSVVLSFTVPLPMDEFAVYNSGRLDLVTPIVLNEGDEIQFFNYGPCRPQAPSIGVFVYPEAAPGTGSSQVLDANRSW